MSFELDVLFLNERGKVLELIRSLPPWKGAKRVSGARYVLEVPVGTIDVSGTQVGDELTWGDPPPYNLSFLAHGPGDADPSSTNQNHRSPSP